MSHLLKPIEAAEKLAVSLNTLRRLIDNGEIAVIAVTGNAKGDRIEPEELERFKKAKKRNRANEVEACQLSNVVTFGGSSSKSTAKQLDDLLAPKRSGKRKRSSAS